MKGLEALEEIKIVNYYEDDEYADDDYLGIRKEIKIIEKELKALEIIKNHELADTLFSYLKVDKTPNEWNWGLPKKMQLTQEEYDLLKEVLK